jgi:hypothetical protein
MSVQRVVDVLTLPKYKWTLVMIMNVRPVRQDKQLAVTTFAEGLVVPSDPSHCGGCAPCVFTCRPASDCVCIDPTQGYDFLGPGVQCKPCPSGQNRLQWILW